MAKLLGLGMNYYHESMGYTARTGQQINADLDRIATLTKRIKVYHSPYENSGGVSAAASLATCKNIVTLAKAKGFYVVWVENHDDGDNHLNGNGSGAYSWEEYSALVIADAAEASSVGADEFLVGNELSIHNDSTVSYYSDANLIANIKTLVTACRGNFAGILGVEEGWWKSGAWGVAGKGSLDKIYFTLYESLADFKTNAQNIFNETTIGTPAIGEWSTGSTYANVAASESDWYIQIANRLKILIDIGFTDIWYFTFTEGADGFGMMVSDDVYHEAWQALFRGRRWFI